MNIFSVLDDSDDEKVQPTAVTKEKKSKEAAPAKAAAAAASTAGNNSAGKAQADKATAKPKGENIPPSNAQKPKDATKSSVVKFSLMNPAIPASEIEEVSKENNRTSKGRGKDPRRGGRGGRGGRGEDGDVPRRRSGEADPKREFERKSGTGRGRELSRGGRGPYGFGNAEQDALEAEKNPAVAIAADGGDGWGEQTDAPADDAAAPPADGAATATDNQPPAVEAEPEPPTFTLDEYLAKREEARLKAAQIVEVKSRVVEPSQFVGLVTKKDEDDTYIPASKSKAATGGKKDQRSTAQTQVLDVSFKFDTTVPARNDGKPPRNNNYRGDRERGGGSGGRGERRYKSGGNPANGKSAAPPTTVFNALDFPAL